MSCPVWPDWAILESSSYQKYLTKVAQIFDYFWSILKDNLKVKTAATKKLGNILSEIGLLFNLISGHTGRAVINFTLKSPIAGTRCVPSFWN